jgi:hypothetical protein
MGMFNDLAKLNKEQTKKQKIETLSPYPTEQEVENKNDGPTGKSEGSSGAKGDAAVVSRHRGITPPRHHDTVKPIRQDTLLLYDQELIDTLRSAVKQVGRIPATTRFTEEEKRILDSIEYEYKMNRNIRTSGNEMIRIAINFLLGDYHKNKEDSLLAKVLESLNK